MITKIHKQKHPKISELKTKIRKFKSNEINKKSKIMSVLRRSCNIFLFFFAKKFRFSTCPKKGRFLANLSQIVTENSSLIYRHLIFRHPAHTTQLMNKH